MVASKSNSEFFHMNSNEDKTSYQIVAFDGIYNFVVEKFFNWNCRISKNCCKFTDFWNLKFKIIKQSRIWTWSIESYISQYDLLLCSWETFYLKLFSVSNMCSKFRYFKIRNLEFINDLECSHSQYQSCSDRPELHVCCWQVFYLKSFRVSNICF
jgi:hypothetical protein